MTTSAPNAKTGFFKGLRVLNTLTNSKVDFVPQSGNEVKWYICGPTVYDEAHMGHARAYLTFDIIRRILEDYFGYDVFCVMNITDIDDKIILRARQAHLLDEYESEKPTVTDGLLREVADAVQAYGFASRRAALEAGPQDTESAAKLELLTRTECTVRAAVMEATAAGFGGPSDALLAAARDVLAPWLDSQHGASITEHSIFDALSRKFEASFLGDMAALGVRPHQVLTRVSEFVPEVVAFVERIVARGMAYESHGSVYFDTVAFVAAGHEYCKCAPHKRGNAAALSEGEGALAAGTERDKRHPNDFALWKRSKDGEPSWDSPWGPGRPGWHIECSAMAGAVLDSPIDIHGGGEDLKFPHHDNEIAQSEAYYGTHQWVNYFLHAGHLHIAGAKMSKSLKNFETIGQALSKHTARQIRLLFLVHGWSGGLDYSDASMVAVRALEKRFKEFFFAVTEAVASEARAGQSASQKWAAADVAFNNELRAARAAVDAAIKDSFDTPTAINALAALVTSTNKYFEAAGGEVRAMLLSSAALYVAKILRVFGVIGDASGADGFGFNAAAAGAAGGDSTFVRSLLETTSAFRDTVRAKAIAKASAAELLALCDELRDESLPELGVRLEDSETGRARIKLDDRDALLAEREVRRKAVAEKAASKATAAAAAAEKEAAKLAKMAVNPRDMFRLRPAEYSEFDDDGMPTKDAAGVAVTKSALKKLAKERDKQVADFAKYTSMQAGSAASQ